MLLIAPLVNKYQQAYILTTGVHGMLFLIACSLLLAEGYEGHGHVLATSSKSSRINQLIHYYVCIVTSQ